MSKIKENPKSDNASTAAENADKKRRVIYRLKLCLGLFGPFAVRALDTTIIASSLAVIATEFGMIPYYFCYY